MAEESEYVFSELTAEETQVTILSLEHMVEVSEARTPSAEDLPMHKRWLDALRSALRKFKGGARTN